MSRNPCAKLHSPERDKTKESVTFVLMQSEVVIQWITLRENSKLLLKYILEEGRLPKEVMKWRPPGRRKQGRPKLTWAEEIRGLMGENRLMEDDRNDRSNWRKKII